MFLGIISRRPWSILVIFDQFDSILRARGFQGGLDVKRFAISGSWPVRPAALLFPK